MKLRAIVATFVLLATTATIAYAASNFHQVQPAEFDPGKTFLVQAQWLSGIGCPTGAKTFDGTTSGTYTDPACTTGDTSDKQNEGLLLAKTGPTTNDASATARLSDVKGITLTELGYDIRKPGSATDPRGSHCGNGAPRFNVETSVAFYFVGCNSPAANSTVVGNGWLRLRWSGAGLMGFNTTTGTITAITGTVKSIEIVFDEGQDTGPDNFGVAILDNVDVNGTLVGRQGGGERDDSDNNGKHRGRNPENDD